MSWFDLLIVAVLAISTVAAFVRGFFLEIFSLAGLFVGLIVASEEYEPVAGWLQQWARRWISSTAARQDMTELAAFLLLSLGVMLLATLIGRLLRGAAQQIGLGFLDRILGAGLGFIKGCVVITLVEMAVMAFLPQAGFVKRSRLAPCFVDAAHQVSHITPVELGDKIRRGTGMLPATGR